MAGQLLDSRDCVGAKQDFLADRRSRDQEHAIPERGPHQFGYGEDQGSAGGNRP